ncbi:hypothetical protein ACVWWI_000171 [Bradyrhizobium sp. USDA 3686]|uniref:hypothetical protein n=1 Tax=Bradyrhizobium canariense TaxID=255045 RepID=UPI001957F5B2|nr:hypothetical protein [Bradyrhizobium canariense]MBM7486713.1 hypothetical protein [Bradyrhizobium canariense]
MATKLGTPKHLAQIAHIMSSEKRAKALLELGAIDPYNETHVSLALSVNTPEAGAAGRQIRSQWDDLWCVEGYIYYQESHVFDITSPSPHDPDVFQQADYTDDDLDSLAATLLKSLRWRRKEQAIYVYLAACFGGGPNSYHLRALALIDRIILHKRIEEAYYH